MKKLNKKGFTLAELLIVIAIIAILIAIAIPAFSASLRSAKLAVDHSNIRAMYAVLRTAELTNSVDDATSTNTAGALVGGDDDFSVYLKKDGTVVKYDSAYTDAYVTQVEAKSDECTESLICKEETGAHHSKDKVITIQYKAASKTWDIVFVDPTP